MPDIGVAKVLHHQMRGATWTVKAFHYYLQGRPCKLRTEVVRWWKMVEPGMPDVILLGLQYVYVQR